MSFQLKSWLEMLYFLSGIVVAGAAIYGLKQIRLLKKDIRLRNERASKEKAIEYGSRYLCTYIKLDNAFFAAYRSEKLESYRGPIGDFTFESIMNSDKHIEMLQKRYSMDSWLPAMNELEAISAAFTSGIADDATGFKIIGRTFCASVEFSYDLIAYSRHRTIDVQGYWSNIVQLYQTWSPRLKESELRQAKEDLERRIAGIASSGARIPAIGTE